MTTDYPHITKSLDTITHISADTARSAECSFSQQNCQYRAGNGIVTLQRHGEACGNAPNEADLRYRYTRDGGAQVLGLPGIDSRSEPMALVTCPECGREISDQATACPGCGHPMAATLTAETTSLPNRSGDHPAPGWYPDPSGERESRYWDGANWTNRVAQVGEGRVKVSPELRKELLAQSLANQLSQSGQWRVESQTDHYAIVVGGKPVNHILHLILTLLTLGVWIIVWILAVIAGGETRFKISIDEYGNGTNQKLG